MIQIERHIEALLLENDCVIVPGLGGFMAHHIDADYSEEEQMFLPPQRTIGFNPQLKLNDSLLAQSYVEVYDISYPEALERIESEVRELRQTLEAEGEYEMHNLGTLSFGEEGQLLFRPCEAGILTPTLYGLGSYEMPLLGAADQSDSGANASTAGKGKASNALAGQQQPARRDALVIPLSWVRGTVAAVAAVVAFFFIVTPVANSYKETGQEVVEHSAFFPFDMKDEAMKNTEQEPQKLAQDLPQATEEATAEAPADTLKETPAENLTETEAEPLTETPTETLTEAKEETPTETETVLPTPTKTYTLVLASYVTKKGAKELSRQLARKGLEEGEVYTHNRITRVVYGTYATEKEARAALKELHWQACEFDEAWVMERELLPR